VRCSANFDKTSHLSRDAEVAATFSGYEYKSGVALAVNARAAAWSRVRPAGEISFRIRKMQSRNALSSECKPRVCRLRRTLSGERLNVPLLEHATHTYPFARDAHIGRVRESRSRKVRLEKRTIIEINASKSTSTRPLFLFFFFLFDSEARVSKQRIISPSTGLPLAFLPSSVRRNTRCHFAKPCNRDRDRGADCAN